MAGETLINARARKGTRTLVVVDRSTPPVTAPCARHAHSLHSTMDSHDNKARGRGEFNQDRYADGQWHTTAHCRRTVHDAVTCACALHARPHHLSLDSHNDAARGRSKSIQDECENATHRRRWSVHDAGDGPVRTPRTLASPLHGRPRR